MRGCDRLEKTQHKTDGKRNTMGRGGALQGIAVRAAVNQ